MSQVIFWKQVRNKEFYRIHFGRQRIIGNYIVDFSIKSLGVVIEIDGSSHDEKEKEDVKRQKFLESLNFIEFRILE